ncbi:hypothetical protein [Alteraurantiacibacter palmitatis]|uniref:Transposase n=1 Tax=Alteraurantiacibacter palmitatis TaxID=2054628 RepID=A0ABV7E0S0_9SPHN
MAGDRFERHRQAWTADEAIRLRTRAGKGKGLKDIARALNRCEESTKDLAKLGSIAIARMR